MAASLVSLRILLLQRRKRSFQIKKVRINIKMGVYIKGFVCWVCVFDLGIKFLCVFLFWDAFFFQRMGQIFFRMNISFWDNSISYIIYWLLEYSTNSCYLKIVWFLMIMETLVYKPFILKSSLTKIKVFIKIFIFIILERFQ